MSFLALFCLLTPTLAGPADDLDQAVSAFRRVASRGELAEREAALDALVNLEDPGATPALIEVYGRCVTAQREAEHKAQQLSYAIEQRKRTIASLALRAKKNQSLEEVLGEQKTALGLLQEQLEREQRRVTEQEPWHEALATGTRDLFTRISDSQQRKAQKLIWEVVENWSNLPEVLASVEMLGQVGSKGTAVQLQKLMAEVGSERQTIERKLPKKEAEVRKMEARMQKEGEQSGGLSNASVQQYNRIMAEASQDRSRAILLGQILDACTLAAAEALAREPKEDQAKALRTLAKGMRKAKDGTRLRSLSILASVPCGPAQATLREVLAGEKDPAAIARTLEDLARIGDPHIADDLLAKYLDHEAWIVQTAAARSLALLREKRGIPAMIARLGSAEGRLATDLREALRSLTAQDFRLNTELWKSWWQEQGDAFQVPPLEEALKVTSEMSKAAGVTFFGINTTSQRVLFILDLSGSMAFSAAPGNNPNDDGGLPPDRPGADEISRLTAAKRDLSRALGGLREDAIFNLVLYATDVWTWQDKMVAMDNDTRVEVLDYIGNLEAKGATNIYGALKQGMELAGATGGDEWSAPLIDTIFLLTDGRPSIGLTTDPDEILGFVRELNQNAGIVIHTIGLSGAQDSYLLSQLAEQNGGTYASR